MAKRKLSHLQKAYRGFFLEMLNKYGVKSQANLNYEKKTEFFIKIREGWKLRKSEIALNSFTPANISKTSGFQRPPK